MLYLASLVASLHYLALAIGLGGVFMRGRYFRTLEKSWNLNTLQAAFAADNFWGTGALLWIATGVARAFGGLERGSGFYLHHRIFWLKMGLFLLVFLLEIRPMLTLIRLRIAQRQGRLVPLSNLQLQRLRHLNDLEVVTVIVIVFVASAMARGLGF